MKNIKHTLGLLILSFALFPSLAFSADQCNTTQQCKSKFGSSATDCKNSQSNNSYCQCGSKRCDSKSSGGSKAKVLYSENFGKKRAPWNQDKVKWGNFGKNNTKGVKLAYTARKKTRSDGSVFFGSSSVGGKKGISRSKAVTISYDIKFNNDWKTKLGGKYHGVGPKKPITGCKKLTAAGWSSRITIVDRVPSLYLYFRGKKSKCGDRIVNKKIKLKKNKWYKLAMYVKVNDKNKKNAVARLYVNGTKVAEKKNFEFHKSGSIDAQIQTFMVSTFLHTPLYDGENLGTQHAHFDNFRIVTGEAPNG